MSDKFEELTTNLLNRTIVFTNLTMDAARKRGYDHFDQIILVGGSTRMPQVSRRLEQDFHLPFRLFEPDEAVAKGAALYGQRLSLQKKIRTKTAEIQKAAAHVSTMNQSATRIIEQSKSVPSLAEPLEIPTALMKQVQSAVVDTLNIEDQATKMLVTSSITNVASHSFGIIATIDFGTPKSRKVISNLVRVNDPLPIIQTKIYGTIEMEQSTVILEIMENTEETWIVEPEKYTHEAEIGAVTLTLPPGLPKGASIEVTLEMNTQGRLHVTGREPLSNTVINTLFETKGTMNTDELQRTKVRSQGISIL